MKRVSATTVKAWLSDQQELAFIDVREHGQYGQAHPFFVSSVPFSRLETLLPVKVPNPQVRMVLIDADDGVAERAAQTARTMGYQNIHLLEGGVSAWQTSGYTLYSGVNVPSKTFAEIMEHIRHTPAMTAQDVAKLVEDGVKHVILDGRPLTEFNKFSIPGASCCPNGELALRIGEIVPDDDTTIIVNCAGRTRSIIGAQTLIDAGVTNPVFALENGTQGWVLAGLERAHGEQAQYPTELNLPVTERREQVQRNARKAGVGVVTAAQVSEWLDDTSRTTYLLDVRTPEEFAANGSTLTVHAPGGQLVQGTDEWIGVRGARIVLIDDGDQVRAPMTGYWLVQLGHQAHVLDGGIAAMKQVTPNQSTGLVKPDLVQPAEVSPGSLDPDSVQLIDVRASTAFRAQHIDGARWSVRPRLAELNLDATKPVVLIGSATQVGLIAQDLRDLQFTEVSALGGNEKDWQQAGLNLVSTASEPADEQCIDHLFFTAERHTGNEAHSHQYLDWEINLVNQLDEQERSVFTVTL